MLHPDVPQRDLVHRRVARLEYALGPRSVGERHAAEDDLDLLVDIFEPRRARVVPHGLLARTWLYSPAAHEYLLVSAHPRLYGWKRGPCMHGFTPPSARVTPVTSRGSPGSVDSSARLSATFLGFFGHGLEAHQLEAEGVDAIQDSVQVGLIHNLTRKDRLTPGIPDLQLLKGHGETLAQLSANHYLVGCSLAATVRAVSIHATLPDDRCRRTPQASPADISHPGELEHAPASPPLVSTLPAAACQHASGLKRPSLSAFQPVQHKADKPPTAGRRRADKPAQQACSTSVPARGLVLGLPHERRPRVCGR